MSHFDSANVRRICRARLITGALALTFGGFLGPMPHAHAENPGVPFVLLDPEARIPALSKGRSAIVILKQRDSIPHMGPISPDHTVSVFVDGAYQASLPKASWTYAEVCPGEHFLNAVQDRTILTVVENKPVGQRYPFDVASTSYFEVREDDQGAPRLAAVDPAAAKLVVEALPRAAHTISRLQTKDCVQPVIAAPPPPTPESAPVVRTDYTLRTSAFFGFDDAHIGHQQGRGKPELDEIIRKMRASYLTVQTIELFGYADPTGRYAYNRTLSQKRADTVAAYLKQSGFASSTITAKGMGATNLAVSDCSTDLKSPQKIRACNEPNRRVELIAHGIPKN